MSVQKRTTAVDITSTEKKQMIRLIRQSKLVGYFNEKQRKTKTINQYLSENNGRTLDKVYKETSDTKFSTSYAKKRKILDLVNKVTNDPRLYAELQEHLAHTFSLQRNT